MPTISSTAVIPAAAIDAFDFVADYRNIPRLQPHFVEAKLITEEAKGAGAEIELNGRFHGIPIRVRNRIIAYSPPLRHVSVSEGPVVSRSTWEFHQMEADPPSTSVTLTLDYKLRDSLVGLAGSLLWPIFNREIQGMTDDSLRRLREFVGEG